MVRAVSSSSSLVVWGGLLFATGCAPRVPSELVPAISPLVGLPVNLCTEEGLNPLPVQITNVGDDDVTIASVEFVPDPDQPAGLASFDAPVVDTETLLADGVAFIQFLYRSPGGVAQQAILRVISDAVVNPTLDIPATTDDFTPEQRALADCEP
jgi:hypothetical protein